MNFIYGIALCFTCVWLKCSYGGYSSSEISLDRITTGPRKTFPAISCPRDTYPLIIHGKIKDCQPGNASYSCPDGFICYFDGINEKYICCGKATGYCDGGPPYLDPDTYQPRRCKPGTGECKVPFECSVKNADSKEGYCCLNLSTVEPPPVGCPWGTRPLRDGNKKLIPCTQGMTNTCPGNTICYYDSIERSNRCCGRDPGEGCPTGMRAIKNNNQIVLCLPGDPQNQCPGDAVCQWSYLIDRFQCCQADDGCPFGSSPFYEPTGNRATRACLPQQPPQSSLPTTPAACPADSNCEFNFWTASYHCCVKKSGLCSAGQVASMDTDTNSARNCVPANPTCPPGYSCQMSSTGQGICCGAVGQCPSGSTIYTDSSGNYHSCTRSSPNTCTRPASCEPSIGGPPEQFLCCVTISGSSLTHSLLHCPSGYEVQSSRSIPCQPSSPTACTDGSLCLPSIAEPTLFLCCQRYAAEPLQDVQTCPNGYRPQSGSIVPCSPSIPSTCRTGDQCLRSPSPPYLFHCCTPFGTQAIQCPANYLLQDSQLIQCVPTSPSGCKPNSVCLQSQNNPNLFICCKSTFSQCPSGFRPQNGLITPCNPSVPGQCQFASSCLHSSTTPGSYICCAAINDYQCPVGFTRQNGQTIQCDSFTFSPCDPVNFCLSPPGQSSSHICCSSPSGTSQSFLQCPANYVRQGDQPIQCHPQNPSLRCSPAANCLPSTDLPSIYICCTGTSSLLGQCPGGYSLQNNVFTQCSPSFPTCISGSQCLPSITNPSLFLCCTPEGVLRCPSGFTLPSAREGGPVTPQVCTPLSSPVCPSDTQCVPSELPTVHICCRPAVLSGTLRCPGNGAPHMSGSMVTFCELGSTACPTGYSCQSAVNAYGSVLCCSPGTLAPSCPGGGIPLPLPDQPGHYTFCTPTRQSCPSRSRCEPATNMDSAYVCCEDASTTGTAFDCPRGYTPLIDPSGLVTFCSGAGSGRCPSPSVCLQAISAPEYFICCQSADQSGARCPLSGSQPLYIAGVVQYCSGPSSPCPRSGYACQYSSTTNHYICCSTSSPSDTVRCANGRPMYRSDPTIFFCNPSLDQCPPQYDCLPSTAPGQSVCCGRSNVPWQCASGRLPFPNGQTPRICSQSIPSCPRETTCEPATFPNQFICCFISGSEARCPDAATPFLEGNSPRRCSGPADLSCPPPYKCSPSDQPNLYICCQFLPGTISMQTRCFSGASAYISPGSTEPEFCTLYTQNCPAGFSCQASTTPEVTICCGAAKQRSYYCPDGTPALVHGTTAQPIICNNPGVVCPESFNCVPSSTDTETRICCSAGRGAGRGADVSASPEVCGPGQKPYTVDNQPQTCQIGPERSCADDYICQQGTDGSYYCCQNFRCPTGVTLLDTDGHPRFCNPALNSCPIGSDCHQSVNLPGNYICCMTSASHRSNLSRCIGRTTYTGPDGKPKMCSTRGTNICPHGTECSSFTTTNDMICCLSTGISTSEGAIPMCPYGDPYRDPQTKEPHYCSDTNYACPDGFICKRAVNSPGHYVCCSGRSACQKGWAPYLDPGARVPLQCSPYDSSGCSSAGPLFKCQQSTKPGEYLCCMESIGDTVKRLLLSDDGIDNRTSLTNITLEEGAG